MTAFSQLSSSVQIFQLAVVLVLSLLSGCATLPEYQPQVPAGSDIENALLDEWLAGRNNNRTLQGVAKVRVQTPERSISGTQVLLAEAPDRLRAESLSPFGTPLLVMTANEAELAVLVPGDNMFYRGRATPENIGRFTRLPLRLADLVGILLARPPLIAYRTLEGSRLPDGSWMVALESGLRRQELVFDAGRHLVGVNYLHADELQLRLVYGEFDANRQIPPRRIEMTLPQQHVQANLVFTELETNREFPPEIFTQSPPQGATIGLLDDMATSQPPH